MTCKNTFLTVCAALSIAGVVSAQTSQGALLTDSQVTRVDASYRAEIRAIGDSAIAAGLSADPIIKRTLQAAFNKAPRDTIIALASRLLRDLRISQAALGAGATQEDIKVGAIAISAGVNSATLTRIAAERRNAELYVSLSVLSDLVTSNVPVDTAVRIVSRLLAAGVRNADLTSYRDNVRNDITIRGAIPSAAATSRGEATILRAGTTDFTTNGPGARVTGRVRIPPEEN